MCEARLFEVLRDEEVLLRDEEVPRVAVVFDDFESPVFLPDCARVDVLLVDSFIIVFVFKLNISRLRPPLARPAVETRNQVYAALSAKDIPKGIRDCNRAAEKDIAPACRIRGRAVPTGFGRCYYSCSTGWRRGFFADGREPYSHHCISFCVVALRINHQALPPLVLW